MDNEKIKRVVLSGLIVWSLLFVYFYTWGNGGEYIELSLYITMLLYTFYVSFDIKSQWKYIWLLLLAWNVIDETFLIFAHDDIFIYFQYMKYPALIIFSLLLLFRTTINNKSMSKQTN